MKIYLALILFICISNAAYCQNYLSNGFANIRAKSYTDLKGAILDMNRIIESNPSDSAYFFRGLLKSRNQDFDGSIEDLKQSLTLNAHNADAYILLAGVYQRRGSFLLFSIPNLGICDYDSSEYIT